MTDVYTLFALEVCLYNWLQQQLQMVQNDQQQLVIAKKKIFF